MKPAVGTLIQYLLDGDTFIIRIQCCVLEVLYRIISNYLLLNLNHKTLTAEKLILKKKKNLQPEKKNNYPIMQETYMYYDIRYGT